MEARIRFYGAAETDCERQEWGYLLGRLYLMAKIGMKSRQHEAGVRMAQDYARYFGLCHIQQPNARALDLFRVHGRAGDGDQEAAEKAKQRHDQIERLLVPNSAVSNVTTAVCVYEHHMTGYYGTALLAGLTRLADFYGIPVDDSQAT
jgi:F420-0:gamma-glutamyl ligase-like protein